MADGRHGVVGIGHRRCYSIAVMGDESRVIKRSCGIHPQYCRCTRKCCRTAGSWSNHLVRLDVGRSDDHFADCQLRAVAGLQNVSASHPCLNGRNARRS